MSFMRGIAAYADPEAELRRREYAARRLGAASAKDREAVREELEKLFGVETLKAVES